MPFTDAVWCNNLKDKISELNMAGIAIENFDHTLSSFHTRITKPFISHLSANINSRFADCKDLLIVFSLFDRRHLPAEANPAYKDELLSFTMISAKVRWVAKVILAL